MIDTEEKTEFKFSELSDSAKQAARDKYLSGEPFDYKWWDFTYEDAVRMGALMGINITSTHHASSHKNHPGYDTADISFSGFCSQGDGASFEGNYWHVPDALQKINSECNDKELIRIAEALTLLQITRRIKGFEPFSATIRARGRHCHSGNMSVTIEYSSEDDLDPIDEIEGEVAKLMRDFADWIYERLEAEYDYLCSDEYVDERLEDDLFDEDGVII